MEAEQTQSTAAICSAGWSMVFVRISALQVNTLAGEPVITGESIIPTLVMSRGQRTEVIYLTPRKVFQEPSRN